MIEKSQLVRIGRINKPHGIHGEMSATIDDDIFDRIDDCPYLICEIDGIFVPFFIEEYRFRNTNVVLIRFEDVNDDETARAFSGRDLYFDRHCFSLAEANAYDKEQASTADGLEGYKIIDSRLGEIGIIIGIDAQTENVLFIVSHNGGELLLPAADDLIDEIDKNARAVRMTLPVGLVNLDEAECE